MSFLIPIFSLTDPVTICGRFAFRTFHFGFFLATPAYIRVKHDTEKIVLKKLNMERQESTKSQKERKKVAAKIANCIVQILMFWKLCTKKKVKAPK